MTQIKSKPDEQSYDTSSPSFISHTTAAFDQKEDIRVVGQKKKSGVVRLVTVKTST